ncbi:MAG TPA: DNA polymerase III subunit beta [Gaiellaceae bacterium]|nr:DNA polymerase III subunit beta [Gaiellaceae bacterium]
MDTDLATPTKLRATCSRAELAEALSVVVRAVSARGAVQVLAGILLRAEEGQLQLAATDMELSLRASVLGEVEGDGAVVVPGRLLADLVRLLPGETVSLVREEGEGVLAITSGSHSSRLNVYSAEDFPRLPPTDVELQELPAAALLETIEKVARAASRDDSRPVLTGILVRFEQDKLVMAATDSYRLAVKETALAAPGPELDGIIPARALQELARLAAGTEEVGLGLHENHVVFRAGEVVLTSRRIDGQFPNYTQLLPETFEVELEVSRQALLDVIRRASVLAQRNAPLRLRFAEGELTVAAHAQEVGEARESLPLDYTGEPLEIGFNPDFLRDGLEVIGAETVQLKLTNPLRPGLILSPSEGFWYLVMPIRLPG